MMSVTDLIRDAISLTNDVARLSGEVKELAKETRQVQMQQNDNIHELDKRIYRIENMLEFAERLKPLDKPKP